MDFRKLVEEGAVAIQGEAGSYSHLATDKIFGPRDIVPCTTFEDAMNAVHIGRAVAAVLPVQNTLAGRVADMHRLLPASGLFGVAEDFLEINHCLMTIKGGRLDDITDIYTHPHAHPQCRVFVTQINQKRTVMGNSPLRIHNDDDTAIAARHVAEWQDPTRAAIASSKAAELYGLSIVADGIQDKHKLNATRFVVFTPTLITPPVTDQCLTMLYCRVPNKAGALTMLSHAIAGRGIDMKRFECYESSDFNTGEALLDVVGHPDTGPLQEALLELIALGMPCKVLGVMTMNRGWLVEKQTADVLARHSI